MSLMNEWNKLDPGSSSSTLYNLFHNASLKSISPVQTILLININNYKMLMIHYELLTRLRLGFSHHISISLEMVLETY